MNVLHSEGYEILWLLWLDTLERLDTLLLELRHHQVNLIHALRAGKLVEGLRYEEDYIWGSYKNNENETHCWSNIFNTEKTQEQLTSLIETWIIQFPDINSYEHHANSDDCGINSFNTDYFSENNHKKCSNDILDFLAYIKKSGAWKSDQRRLYNAFRALQILKGEILNSKLALCRWGSIALRHKKDSLFAGQFLVIRAAVMSEIHEHIKRLSDLRAQFEAALDLGIQDHPAPQIGRRVEQGIYSSFLSERCRGLRDIIEDFLEQTIEYKKDKENTTHGSIYLHRWSHSSISEASFIKSILDYDKDDGIYSVDLFNTSFFMPDRPDLQSVIAHEVAHSAIFHGLGDLDPALLRQTNGSLPTLLRLISTCFEAYEISNNINGEPRYELRMIHREVACDIIAAIVSGPSYLFALLQEIIGQDLDLLFSSPLRRYDYNLAEHIISDGWVSMSFPGFEWYIRLNVICAVLENLHTSTDTLTTRLIHGVRQVSETLIDTVDYVAPIYLIEDIKRWRNAAHTVTEVIGASELIADARNWQQESRGLTQIPTENEDDPYISIQQPMSAYPLRASVQDKLVSLITQLKSRKNRPLYETRKSLSHLYSPTESLNDEFNKSMKDAFYSFYFGCDEKKRRKCNDDKFYLFRNLHDITWQSAIFRARDFLHPKKGHINKSDPWLQLMHIDGAPGRHLYQLALELSYWLAPPNKDSIMFIISFMKSHEACFKSILPAETIKQWTANKIQHEEWGFLNIIHKALVINDRKINTIIKEAVFRDAFGTLSDKIHRYSSILFTANKSDIKQVVKSNNRITKEPSDSSIELAERMLARLRHAKILELKSMLENHANALGPVNTLYVYLESLSRSQGIRAEHLKSLTTTNSPDDDEISPLITLDRVVISQETINSQPHDYFYQDSNYKHYTKTLGRYDYIGLKLEDRPHGSRLPKFNYEESPPFFERHERGQRYRLNPHTPLPKLFTDKENPIAFLCITLGSRTSRLDFAHRLRSLINNKSNMLENPTPKKDNYLMEWHDLPHHINEEDGVFLTEGWGDVVIAFKADHKDPDAIYQRMHSVFAAQNAIYEDFLVDQTELILGAPCLQAIAQNGLDIQLDDPKYSLIIRVKLRGNAGRIYEILDAEDPQVATKPNRKLITSLKRFVETNCLINNGMSITRTPGRTDMTIHIYCAELLNKKTGCGTMGLYDCLKDADEVLTIIGEHTLAPPRLEKCQKCGSRA